jgi:quinone-modifying oxidoreductase subunit QmoC
MGARVVPGLHREIAKYGAKDVDVCMNCGNCTAVCPLSTESEAFPRRIIHLLQVGHKEKLAESVEPWLCYYCGECSESCPREANPGETMMAVRRYLTALYDWTGLGKKFYTSPVLEIGALAAVGLFVVALFALFHGPVVTDRVALNTFAPAKWVEAGDLLMAAVLSILLLSNAFRMFRFFMRGEGRPTIPLWLYVQELPTFVTHFATQKRWRQCEGNRITWLTHLFLVTGYLTMLTLVVFFLRWFQTDLVYPIYHPQRLLGYYATGVLLYVTASMMIGRLRHNGQLHRFSEPTDWVFLSLLFLTAFTGILLHLARIGGFPLLTYSIYVIHLAIAVPMLVVEVPFGKWAHMFYRPFAMYLVTVREKAGALHGEVAEMAA